LVRFGFLAILALVRLPVELNIAPKLWLAGYGESMFPVRALLKNPKLEGRHLLFTAFERQHPEARECQTDALRSIEMQTHFASAEQVMVPMGALVPTLKETAPSTIVLIDCGRDGQKDPDVERVCAQKQSLGRVLGFEPVDPDNFTRWIMIEYGVP
jgi:hypothetical protein